MPASMKFQLLDERRIEFYEQGERFSFAFFFLSMQRVPRPNFRSNEGINLLKLQAFAHGKSVQATRRT
jgi:hypothetical protein